MIVFKPFRLHYSAAGGRLVVYLCGRNSDGSRGKYELYDTRPYFFVRPDEAEELLGPRAPRNEMVMAVEPDAGVTLWGAPLTKVVTRYPFDVPRVREKFSATFEADVIYENRIRYDYGIRNVITFPNRPVLQPEDIQPVVNPTEIPPRVFVLDIETMDTVTRSRPDNPQAPVVSIAIWDSKSNQYLVIVNGRVDDRAFQHAGAYFVKRGWPVKILSVESEAALFEAFKNFVEGFPPDILAGWFSNGFDFPYLQKRAEQQNYASIEWNDYALFDVMLAYKRRHENEATSLKLDDVAKALGIGEKIPRPSIRELYDHDRGALIAYNANDAFLTKEIMLKQSLHTFFLETAALSGCGIQDLWYERGGKWKFNTGIVVDAFVFHWLKERGGGIQASKTHHEKEEKVKGARILDSAHGIFQNVVEYDNTGEYANIIRAFNLSPETRRPGCDCNGEQCFVLPQSHPTEEHKWLPGGNHYTKEPRGIFPSIIDELLIVRQKKKAAGEEEQYRVIKELVNSFYGSLASKYYRNSDPVIAADITRIARLHLDWNKDFFERKGFKILAGDTDSCHVWFEGWEGEKVGPESQRLLAELNGSLPQFAAQWGAKETDLGVKIEHHYDWMLLVGAQKRYACVYRDAKGTFDYEGTRYALKARGFEIRKANAAEVTRSLQRVIFERGIFGIPVRDELLAVIEDAKAHPHKCGIPQTLQKDADEYKTEGNQTLHFKAAQWSNKNLGKDYTVGDKPCLYFGYIKGKEHTEVFALDLDEPLPEGAVIDWPRTLERVVVKPLEELLDVVGLTPDEILAPTEDLEAFFA